MESTRKLRSALPIDTGAFVSVYAVVPFLIFSVFTVLTLSTHTPLSTFSLTLLLILHFFPGHEYASYDTV